jgi:hypothetical protein
MFSYVFVCSGIFSSFIVKKRVRKGRREQQALLHVRFSYINMLGWRGKGERRWCYDGGAT